MLKKQEGTADCFVCGGRGQSSCQVSPSLWVNGKCCARLKQQGCTCERLSNSSQSSSWMLACCLHCGCLRVVVFIAGWGRQQIFAATGEERAAFGGREMWAQVMGEIGDSGGESPVAMSTDGVRCKLLGKSTSSVWDVADEKTVILPTDAAFRNFCTGVIFSFAVLNFVCPGVT